MDAENCGCLAMRAWYTTQPPSQECKCYDAGMLVLEVIEGPDLGGVFPLPQDEPQLIGRSSEALPLADPTISRRHAELTPDEGKWYLRDLESANGTYLNGRLLTERVALRVGDEVGCGATLFGLLNMQP